MPAWERRRKNTFILRCVGSGILIHLIPRWRRSVRGMFSVASRGQGACSSAACSPPASSRTSTKQRRKRVVQGDESGFVTVRKITARGNDGVAECLLVPRTRLLTGHGAAAAAVVKSHNTTYVTLLFELGQGLLQLHVST